MPNQSGKILLVLILIVILVLAAGYLFLWSDKKPQTSEQTLENTRNLDLSQSKSDSRNIASKALAISIAAIVLDYPVGMTEELLAEPQSMGSIKQILPERVYKLYLNLDSNLNEDEKMYSGLTMFVIVYPNNEKVGLENFLPQTEAGDKNHTDVIQDAVIGQFKGAKRIQCCYAGGVVEYYFLNKDSSKLILIKAYNYGQDNDYYQQELDKILNSIKPLR